MHACKYVHVLSALIIFSLRMHKTLRIVRLQLSGHAYMRACVFV